MLELSKGTLLHGGSYRIEEVLGQGSFGITYLATHTSLEKKYAIKEFFMKGLNTRNEDGSITGMSDDSLSYNYGQKFKKEALNLAHLEHPNIVKVTDSFEDNGTFYYVMEYIDGTNLNEYIKQHTISEQEGVSIIRSVAEALIYMHEEKHMLHLDLKPGNVMRRSSDGHIFLIDFGLSKHYDKSGAPETSTTIGLGTPGYAPTEQGDNTKQGEFRPTIDVYALGATLLKLVTGETPPSASTLVSDDEVLPDLLRKKGISDDLSSVIINAMIPSVKKRIQTIRYFVEALPKNGTPAIDEEELTDVISESEDNTNNDLTDVIEEKAGTDEDTVIVDDIESESVYEFDEEEFIIPKIYTDNPQLTENRAHRGEADYMFAIAIMYLRGEEVAQDSDMAFLWIQQAKNAGDKRAKAVYDQWYRLKDRYKKKSTNTPKPGTDDDNDSTESGRTAWGVMLGIFAIVVCIICIMTCNGNGTNLKVDDEGNSNTPHFNYETYRVNGVSFDMVKVEGGTFMMGSNDADADENEKPIHKVTLSDYYIGKTEVTQKLWKAVMGSNHSISKGDNLPVDNVMSWHSCQKFIEKLNAKTGLTFRLPTEAEWEFAARGGNLSHGFKYSGSNNIDDVAWYWKNSGDKYLNGTDNDFDRYKTDKNNNETHPVATKRPNELGIYDMSGNVQEWCSDWGGPYSSSDQINPTGPSEQIIGYYRVLRGGIYCGSADWSRSSYRKLEASGCTGEYGFRIVLDLPH